MKKLIICILFLSMQSKADVIVSAVIKNGPNGYEAMGTSSSTSTSSSSAKCCHTPASTTSSNTTVNGIDITNRVESNLGVRLEYIAKDNPLAVGIGVFQDSTVEASVGFKLW